MEKKQYWIVESNGDLSVTTDSLEECKILIDADFNDLPLEHQEETRYTISPTWMMQEEYENLPEA